MKKNLLTILIVMLFSTTMSATVYKVGPGWSAPDYATLQELITAGSNGKDDGKAEGDEIWVSGDQVLSAQWILHGWRSKLYGGFAGTETSIEQRQKVAGGMPWEFVNPTTISLADTVTLANSILRVSGTGDNNTAMTEIDGFTFDGTHCLNSVLFFRTSTRGINVRNCIIKNGTIPTDNSLTTTSDCIAGGISVGSDDSVFPQSLTIDGCLVQGNQGRVGGIYVKVNNNNAVNIVISNSAILGNTSKVGTGTVTAFNSGDGGGMNFGSGMNINPNGSIRVINCIIADNKSDGVGAALINNLQKVSGAALILNSTIANNTATAEAADNTKGGGIRLPQDIDIYNSIFYNNTLKDGSIVHKGGGKIPVGTNNLMDELGGMTEANGTVSAINPFANGKSDYYKPASDFAGVNAGISPSGMTILPVVDILGNERIVKTIDIGPYENQDDQSGIENINGDSLDPVVATHYYNLQGVEMQKPTGTGVFIAKETLQSGKTRATKFVYVRK